MPDLKEGEFKACKDAEWEVFAAVLAMEGPTGPEFCLNRGRRMKQHVGQAFSECSRALFALGLWCCC